MSQEEIRRTASHGALSGTSDHGSSLSLCHSQDQDMESKSQGHDSIVLERIASLSLDSYDPSAFTGRFTKIQPRSRKRTTIIGSRCKQDLLFLFIRVNVRMVTSTKQTVVIDVQ